MKQGNSFYLTGDQPPRRVRVIWVTADALIALWKLLDGTQLVKVAGLPRDARCVGIVTHPSRGINTIGLYIESDDADFPYVTSDVDPLDLVLVER